MITSYKLIFLALLVSFLLPLAAPVLAEIPANLPNNMSEAQEKGKTILNAVPGVVSQLWPEFKGYLWQLAGWLIGLWKQYAYPPIQSLWNREIAPREPAVQQEFQKEQQEMGTDIKNEVPKITKNIWDRFMELVYPK